MEKKTEEQKAKSKKDSKKDRSIKMHRLRLPAIRSLKRGI